MRRMIGLLVGAALVAACTAEPGVSVVTDPPATAVDDAGGESTASGAGGAGDGPTGVAVDPGATELPGLLDPSDDPLPNDTEVRTGTLDNGLVYYVRANDNPGGKAELRLAVRAGSVDELGEATGVAHFVEHMLFNGTEAFPENELVDTLRGFGAAFGADVNAYTSYDETVYQLTVPNEPDTVELGLSVLEQWLSHATISDDQVVAERGVVLDEWRVRTQTTNGRLARVASEMYLAGTPYDDRSPIGDEVSVATMTTDELRRYYDAWYRPDNAAVVVVGDIDVDAVVADVERLFGPATARGADRPAPVEPRFPVDTTPEYAVHVDPDQQTVDVEVTLPLPATEGAGTAALRAGLIDDMIFRALIRRLERDRAAGTAPFDLVVPGTNSFVAALDAPALYAVTDAERVSDTLQALLDEYARAARFGFDADETDLARDAVRAPYDSLLDGRDSTQDAVYADRYVAAFTTDAAHVSIDDEHALATAILDAVTPEALDLRFRARWANSAPHVIVSTPAGLADRMPSEQDVLAAIAALPGRELAPRGAGRDLPEALMDRPAAVDPVGRRDLLARAAPFFDPIELTYANGVRVILTANDIVEGQTFLAAGSPGGSSLVADDDLPDAHHAAEIVLSGGVADFDEAELSEIIAGDDVELTARIDPYSDHFDGSAATADVETLFQLIHLSMTAPRFDPVALDGLRRRLGPVVADPGGSPFLAGIDALAEERYAGEIRYDQLLAPELFDTLDLGGVERVWRDRFGDAGDWVFVFAGDFDVATMTAFAGAYLGTLPGGGAAEVPVDVADPPPAGVVGRTVEAGTGDTASALLLSTAPLTDIDGTVRAHADVATQLITSRLTDVIREELGASYSPFAATEVSTDPEPVIETFVRVTGSPDRIDEIAGIVVAELTSLRDEGPTEREFANAYAQVDERYGFVDNETFLRELLADAIDPYQELDDYLGEPDGLDDVTPSSLQGFVEAFVPVDQYVVVTVVPR